MNPIFHGSILKGKVIFDDRDSFDNYLLSLENMFVDIVIKKRRKDRSNQQNRDMWGVVYKIISETTGHTEDEIHDSMRAMFLMDNLGKFPIMRSSTSLTTAEMEEYLEKIRQWAAQELSCIIPLPNEVET